MKKKTPLAILEIAQPLVDKNSDTVESIKNSDVIFHINDKMKIPTFFIRLYDRKCQTENLVTS